MDFFQYTWWLWDSQTFQQEVGLNYMLCWKSVNIRGINDNWNKKAFHYTLQELQ